MAVDVWDGIPQVPAQYAQKAATAIRKAALDMEARVKKNIAEVPHFENGQTVGLGAIRTGAMRASVWTLTGSSLQNNTPGGARAAARSGAITGTTIRAFVGVGVKYAPYVEYGTKRMKARPFFEPAYKDTKKALVGYLKTLK